MSQIFCIVFIEYSNNYAIDLQYNLILCFSKPSEFCKMKLDKHEFTIKHVISKMNIFCNNELFFPGTYLYTESSSPNKPGQIARLASFIIKGSVTSCQVQIYINQKNKFYEYF